MKNPKKIILSIIGTEAFLAVIFFTLLGNSCGSACSSYRYSILNPFGYRSPDETPDFCINMCVYSPHPLFYIVTDLLIVTVIGYLIYVLVKKYIAPSNN